MSILSIKHNAEKAFFRSPVMIELHSYTEKRGHPPTFELKIIISSVYHYDFNGQMGTRTQKFPCVSIFICRARFILLPTQTTRLAGNPLSACIQKSVCIYLSR